jgi:hypothetical protein
MVRHGKWGMQLDTTIQKWLRNLLKQQPSIISQYDSTSGIQRKNGDFKNWKTGGVQPPFEGGGTDFFHISFSWLFTYNFGSRKTLPPASVLVVGVDDCSSSVILLSLKNST